MTLFFFCRPPRSLQSNLCWTPDPPMRTSTQQLNSEETQQLDIPWLDRYVAVPCHSGQDWFVCECILDVSCSAMVCSKRTLFRSRVRSTLCLKNCLKVTFDRSRNRAVKQSAAKILRYSDMLSSRWSKNHEFSCCLHCSTLDKNQRNPSRIISICIFTLMCNVDTTDQSHGLCNNHLRFTGRWFRK